jgi:ATP-dependent helicase/nuclease subunit A
VTGRSVPPRLPDQDARDRAVCSRGDNLVVEASAGTGKTNLLVKRVVSLASGGSPLDQMAVVTFTDAAAAELRSRIRHSISSMARGAVRDECLRTLPGALIGTIHGFASRVLKDYFYLTGVDPSFSAGGQAFPDAELARLWDRYLAGLPESALADGADILIELPGINRAALELADMPWIEWPRSFLPEGSTIEVPWGRWIAECDALREMAGEVSPPDTPAGSFLKVCPVLGELLRSRAGLRRMLPALKRMDLRSPAKTRWPSPEALAEAKAIAGRLRTEIPSVLLTSQFGRLLWPFVEELRLLRSKDRSSLTFDDLLYRCHSALAAKPVLREAVSARFGNVLIDEFQDTSGIQVRLFREFLSDGDGILPGRLTVVGDPKQSIYGWRNADIETFKSTIDGLAGCGQRESINVSMRSTKRIVAFVNAFGEVLFSGTPPEESRFACDYAPLVPRPDAEQGCRVTVALVPAAPDENARRRLEASWLADFLRREAAAATGAWAILFRSLTGIETYLHAFSAAGLPWSLDAGRDFKSRPETADLRALLTVLLVPSDRGALLSVLRSPFFSIPDDEITSAVLGGLDGYLGVPESAGPRIRPACRLLEGLRAVAAKAPPAELLQAILFRTGFAASVAASGWETGRRFANLRYLYDWCLSSGTASTADLLDAISEKGLGSTSMEDPSTPPSDDCAITIGTIHGAKGLTYANVVLVGTQRSGNRSGDVMKDEGAGRAAVSFHDGRGTPLTEEVRDSNRRLSDAESRRLAYVAATRAAKRLVVLTHQDGGSGAGFFAEIVRSAALAAVEKEPEAVSSEVMGLMEYPFATRPKPAVIHSGGTWSLPAPVPPEAGPPDEDDSPAIRLGNAVHSILEKIDLADPGGWMERNLADSALPAGVDRDAAARLALSLFGLDGLPVDLTRAKVDREFPCIALDGEGYPEESYIDLLADDGDSLHAIDYKTDDPSASGGMDALVERYRQRQEIYGKLVARASGRKVSVWLALLSAGEVKKIGEYLPPDRRPTRT